MITLSELMNAVTLEGAIRIRIWDHDADDYSFDKWLDEFTDPDRWVYSLTVKYIYPYWDYKLNVAESAFAIELSKED